MGQGQGQGGCCAVAAVWFAHKHRVVGLEGTPVIVEL